MFTPDDIRNYKMFKALVDQGGYEVKGDAIMMVASLYKWFLDLEGKMVIPTGPLGPLKPLTPQIIEEPIKKMGKKK